MTAACIRRLTLTNFRSYHAAQISLARAGPVVVTGANGAGKTNLIEAISLLAPGRGLRRATMEELAFTEGDGGWAVSAEIEGMLGLATLGTGIDPPVAEDAVSTRKCRIDRQYKPVEKTPPVGCRPIEQRVHGGGEPHHAQVVGETGGRAERFAVDAAFARGRILLVGRIDAGAER